MSDLVKLRQFLAGVDTRDAAGGDRQRRLDDAVPDGKARHDTTNDNGDWVAS